MKEQKPNDHVKLEKKLIHLYRSHSPDTAFTDRLENRLLKRALKMKEGKTDPPSRWLRPLDVKLAVSLTLALVVTLAAFAVSPPLRSWAQEIIRPTPHNAPMPGTIVLSGSGDDVVDIEKEEGPAVAMITNITHQDESDFIVRSYGSDGEEIGLLVNAMGSYQVARPLDVTEGECTTRLKIESSGEWLIQIWPLPDFRTVEAPGTIEGRGDEYVLLKGDPDLLKIDATKAEGKFVLWRFGRGIHRVVDEPAPYKVSVIAGKDTFLLYIEAEGEWSIEVTSKAPSTPAITHTPELTSTPQPTNTPHPTPQNTPVLKTIHISGTGDEVVDIEKWEGPAVVHITNNTYLDESDFIVRSYGPDGEEMDLLANTTGSYQVARPMDFTEGERTTRLKIESSGEWLIQIFPQPEFRTVEAPGTIEGRGDEYVFLKGEPDLLKIDATKAKGKFVVWKIGRGTYRIVDEIAPYEVTVVAGEGTFMLYIEAEGEWSIEVTSK